MQRQARVIKPSRASVSGAVAKRASAPRKTKAVAMTGAAAPMVAENNAQLLALGAPGAPAPVAPCSPRAAKKNAEEAAASAGAAQPPACADNKKAVDDATPVPFGRMPSLSELRDAPAPHGFKKITTADSITFVRVHDVDAADDNVGPGAAAAVASPPAVKKENASADAQPGGVKFETPVKEMAIVPFGVRYSPAASDDDDPGYELPFDFDEELKQQRLCVAAAAKVDADRLQLQLSCGASNPTPDPGASAQERAPAPAPVTETPASMSAPYSGGSIKMGDKAALLAAVTHQAVAGMPQMTDKQRGLLKKFNVADDVLDAIPTASLASELIEAAIKARHAWAGARP